MNKMIRHCVFLKPYAEISEIEIEAIMQELKNLGISGIQNFQYGKNVSVEKLGKGFRYGFTIDFLTEKNRDDYLENPEHKKIGKKLVAALQGGPEGLLVFDMSIN